MKRALILLVIVLGILGFVFWKVSEEKSLSTGSSAKPKEISEDYEEVKLGDLVTTIEGTGIVEPRTTARVKSEATGVVEELRIEEGDVVKKGDIIAILDQEDQKILLKKAILAEQLARIRYEQVKKSDLPKQMATAKARVEELKLSLKNAQDRLERIEQLFRQGYATDQEVEDARKAFESIKVQLEEAENNLRILESEDYAQIVESARLAWEQAKVDVEDAKKTLGEATIKSPIDGTVLSKNVEEGDTVVSSKQGFTEGTTICTIADLSQVQVRGSVDEVDIGEVKIGQEAELTVDAYPGRTYVGRVTNIYPQGEKQPGGLTTFTVIVSVNNEDRSLLANMTATIKIKTKELKNVLLVPFSAIQPGEKENETIVYVRNEKGIPEVRKVVLGATDYEHYEVKEGLKEGDLVKIKNFPKKPPTKS